jgi:hypothetical protein
MAAGDIIVIDERCHACKGNYFDGTDDYVLHDAHAVERVAANDTVGTYTAWIYLDKTPTVSQAILSAGDNDSASEYLQFYVTTGRLLKILLYQGGAEKFKIFTTKEITPRVWTHVAVVQNGVQPVLYINGVLETSTNEVATDLTMWYDELANCDKFAIGVLESNATHTNDFMGAIGQVKYFALALTAEEIMREYQGIAHTGFDRAAALATALTFNVTMADNGTTDSGSGADNGTLTGNAHYGGEISNHSLALERNCSGHAAEAVTTYERAGNRVSIIRRGD